MRRVAVIIVIAYALILVVLTVPFIFVAFRGTATKIDYSVMFRQWIYWLWLIAMAGGQAALLLFPVRVAEKRPVTTRSLAGPIAASSVMMAVLAAGLIFAVNELAANALMAGKAKLLLLAVFILVWTLWALIFLRWTRQGEPGAVFDRLRRTVYRGSALELLIAVPSHLIVRHRAYCCAGFDTFVALAFGFSVMLFSFGPGVLFLYSGRLMKKKGASVGRAQIGE